MFSSKELIIRFELNGDVLQEISSADIITTSGLTNGTKQTTFKKFDGSKFKDVNF